jgi:hypothetical protein
MRTASCSSEPRTLDGGSFCAKVSCSGSAARGGSRGIRGAFLAIALFSLAACGNDNLDESQQLGPLRVLALIADRPEVTIDDATPVIITGWISDYDKGGEPGRSLTYSYASCPDPGVAYGVEPRCPDDSRISFGGGSIDGTQLTSVNAYTAAAFTQGVPIPTTAFAPWNLYWSSRTAAEKANGVAILVTFTISSGTEQTTAFRRITVTTRTGAALNQNSLAITGISPATLPTSEGKVSPTLVATADNYSVTTSNGTVVNRTEKLTVSWYTTAGEFKFNRTDGSSANTWTPPDNGTAKVFLFLRDDRGGVSDAFSL